MFHGLTVWGASAIPSHFINPKSASFYLLLQLSKKEISDGLGRQIVGITFATWRKTCYKKASLYIDEQDSGPYWWTSTF